MKFLRLPLLIPAALIVLAVRLLGRYGIVIRFGNFLSSRIGHLVGNTEVYLCERDAGQHPYIDIWTHYGEPASPQIDKMLRRILRIWPYRITALTMVINKMFSGWERHDIGSKHLDRDPENLLAKYPPHLKFTTAEIEEAEATLRGWGVSKGAQWVCLMVRDAAYLPTLYYHSYRDSDVDDYAEAAIALAERGYHVFRMGKTMAKAFNVKHERIHDFAMNGMYSDLMSAYLGAHCAFTLSTSTGWDAIPQAFRRPMGYVNFAPYEYFPTWLPNSLLIWKHHWKDGKRMTPAEIAASGAGKFMRADQFEDAGIELRNNTPAEIRAVALEMAQMMEGRFHPGPQTAYWDAYPRSLTETGQPLHGDIRMKICVNFLQEYENAERKADTRDHSGQGRLKAGAV